VALPIHGDWTRISTGITHFSDEKADPIDTYICSYISGI
jgi:hypothetical protein